MKKTFMLLALGAGLAVGQVQGQGVLYNLQFGASLHSGAAIYGNAGDHWNSFNSASASSVVLLNTANQPGGVTASWTGDGIANSEYGNGFTSDYSNPYFNLMADFLYANGSGAISFSGLTANQTYGLCLYTQGDWWATGRQISVVTDTGTYNSTPGDRDASTFILGQNYLLITATANSSGVLALNYSALAGQANINGLQLLDGVAPVPEPSTLALAGLGGLALLCCRRRK